MRLSGQVRPTIPRSAPLNYRLSNEVYALDGMGNSCRCGTGDIPPMGGTTKLLIALGVLAVIGSVFIKKG